MHNLVRVIGPAPSELSQEDLYARLKIERQRVREALQTFRNSTSPTQSKAKVLSLKKKEEKQMTDLALKFGITVEALKLMIEEDSNA